MNIKAFLAAPLAFLMMLVSLALPPKAQAPDSIAQIEVRWVYLEGNTRKFKIDLARKNLWTHEGTRNENSPFGGYLFAGRLSGEKIAVFLEAAEECGFADWEGEYKCKLIMEAYWSVTVLFADGTKRVSYGNGAGGFPEHWSEMRDAFKALTGMDILSH